ncbi:MAG: hypothetical protein A2998_03255 [Candidatus Staskawiczbacteria bacterium RIFCSPLOWO2_01_FULL_37_25b]|uniref:Uncharacterized protein n=2 Tax=Candidatus Staskawicziibacteriota TaxID=1817916 RepID=A0A1G2HK86_9BACT|nr:MAG: hypothetical protein A2812_03115 [Candidatus Staskawiczbacteria bacterium RIFCSPHIGHO2_01_FULL_36_16]OGZ71740.1 MAG: hypothetical protein A2998_03255 [Candidatus Staskawiczbacteria bacterium RIFCSPLOWO2_01_FULL_37_25b]
MFIDKKNILSLLIILSFLAILILPSFLNMCICIADGYTFSPNICRDGVCINETIGQHLNEKSQLFVAIVKWQIFSIVFFVSFFVANKYLKDKKQVYAKSYAKQGPLSYSFNGINYLIEAFSSGIVNPKIF